MNCLQQRFYDVMEVFGDDERLAAHALVDFLHVQIDANIIDEIEALFLSTIYKLRFLE